MWMINNKGNALQDGLGAAVAARVDFAMIGRDDDVRLSSQRMLVHCIQDALNVFDGSRDGLVVRVCWIVSRRHAMVMRLGVDVCKVHQEKPERIRRLIQSFAGNVRTVVIRHIVRMAIQAIMFYEANVGQRHQLLRWRNVQLDWQRLMAPQRIVHRIRRHRSVSLFCFFDYFDCLD